MPFTSKNGGSHHFTGTTTNKSKKLSRIHILLPKEASFPHSLSSHFFPLLSLNFNRKTPMSSLILLLFSLSFSAADRILHEPLYPIQWTPPPPPSGDPYPITEASPPQFALSDSHHSNSARTKLAIGVSLSICAAAAILSLFAYFLYRRRAKSQPESRKLIGDSRSFSVPDLSFSAADFLYLGTMEPVVSSAQRLGEESKGSPCSKQSSEIERVVEMQHNPSPELQPLPPLRRNPPAYSDEDTYFTPKRSAASRNSESPNSHRSRQNQPNSVSGKETPRSKRSSPRMQISDYSPSDAKREVSTNNSHLPPPPPPPPPPIFSKKEKTNNLASPSIKHQGFGGVISELKEVSDSMRTSWTFSRRQLLRPLPPEDAARADLQSSINALLVSGEGCSSSKRVDGEKIDFDGEEKPKLKALHWDEVRASSDRAMVWDQLKSDSFRLNEDMIEALFVNDSSAPPPKEQSRRAALPPLKQEDRVLDPKKSQNIAILLRALNVTREEVSDALLDGNTEGLGPELFETLVKMAPSKEEELKLRDYNGDVSKLGSAERFLKGVLAIPFAFKRVDAMLYKANFEAEINYLRTSFGTLEAACEDLRGSKLFLKLLEAVLMTGNRMNVGTNHGEAKAFKLDALLKLSDVKGIDGNTTILHFVVEELIHSEGLLASEAATDHPNKNMELKKKGLKVIAGLSNELGNVKKAAGMDTDVLSSYLSKLELGHQKIRSVLQLGESCEQGQKFFDNMRIFLQESEQEIDMVKFEVKRALQRVREVTEYFHGVAAKEEAHPLRIFIVVRDFLAILDHVCKDVGRLHGRTVTGSGKSFRFPVSSALPVLHRYVPNTAANSDEPS